MGPTSTQLPEFKGAEPVEKTIQFRKIDLWKKIIALCEKSTRAEPDGEDDTVGGMEKTIQWVIIHVGSNNGDDYDEEEEFQDTCADSEGEDERLEDILEHLIHAPIHDPIHDQAKESGLRGSNIAGEAFATQVKNCHPDIMKVERNKAITLATKNDRNSNIVGMLALKGYSPSWTRPEL
ncbi:hypothetical protein L6452_34321 [Arctium lappa]|uniref:Uncharacterized protein n=1 Tax=Arctium lappa TaxID=4217 RepID=A0ACB8YIG6_ARCLA|nr:hypothetical protein L6452_34321 [Arctium lappa]